MWSGPSGLCWCIVIFSLIRAVLQTFLFHPLANFALSGSSFIRRDSQQFYGFIIRYWQDARFGYGCCYQLHALVWVCAWVRAGSALLHHQRNSNDGEKKPEDNCISRTLAGGLRSDLIRAPADSWWNVMKVASIIRFRFIVCRPLKTFAPQFLCCVVLFN